VALGALKRNRKEKRLLELSREVGKLSDKTRAVEGRLEKTADVSDSRARGVEDRLEKPLTCLVYVL